MNKSEKYMDKFEGAVIGSAIGDAFGYPLMKLSFEEICETFEKKGAMELAVSRKTKTALLTEATQMSLFTADGILWAHNERVSDENAAVANYVFYSYQMWLYMQTKTIAGAEYEWLFDKKRNPNLSSLLKSKGLGRSRRLNDVNVDALLEAKNNNFGTLNKKVNENKDAGAVKRVVTAGLFYGQSPDMAFRMGCDIGAITHSHPDGYLPCGVYAAVVAELMTDKSVEEAVNNAMALLAAYPENENTYNMLQTAIDLAGNEDIDPQEGIGELGDGLSAVSCLAIAVYSAIVHQTNFKFAIELAANHDGDSAACGAITGGILGVWYGLKKLPKPWIKKMQYLNLMETVSDVLFENSSYARAAYTGDDDDDDDDAEDEEDDDDDE
ncbi:MAG: ADP-ribosylglycohydrolase family protein [Bacteroides sp.]|nr:ADP-ribosylglycohydrolase family protein [Bacteroides sp.]